MNKKWYESSLGNGNLALTVRGALVAILPLVIGILQAKGFAITETTVLEVFDAIVTALAAIMIVVGLVRKLYFAMMRADGVSGYEE